jgi:hypothetical protein
METYAQIAKKIIENQETIIGPVAIEQAEQVPELRINWPQHHEVVVRGDGVRAVDKLVERYKRLFGQVSVEVSKEAVHGMLAHMQPEQLPHTLR